MQPRLLFEVDQSKVSDFSTCLSEELKSFAQCKIAQYNFDFTKDCPLKEPTSGSQQQSQFPKLLPSGLGSEDASEREVAVLEFKWEPLAQNQQPQVKEPQNLQTPKRDLTQTSVHAETLEQDSTAEKDQEQKRTFQQMRLQKISQDETQLGAVIGHLYKTTLFASFAIGKKRCSPEPLDFNNLTEKDLFKPELKRKTTI